MTGTVGRMSRFDLVVTDLDGTLWDGDERVHPDTAGALERIEQAGVRLLVATGRRRRSAARGLAAVGLRPPAVVLGGALGLDLDSFTEFHRRAFAAEAAAAVLEVFDDHGLQPCVYVEQGDCDVLVGDRPATHPRHLEALGDWARPCDLRQQVRERPVLNFGLVGGDEAILRRIAAELRDLASPVVNRDLVFAGQTLMVAPPAISKWEGIRAYCALEGLDPARVLAVGDGANDVEMLDAAALACVVSDGGDEALAHADVVIPPTGEGGWATIADLLA